MSDAGSDWISRFLNEGVRGGRRCVVIGGTEEFFEFLLFNGYAVAHIDKDQNELYAIRHALADEMGSALDGLEQYAIDLECEDGFAWRSDDILILIRSLHHLRDPQQFLARMHTTLSEGTILIVDWAEFDRIDDIRYSDNFWSSNRHI